MSKRSERKEEHLALAQMFFDKERQNSFDQVHLLRPALPEAKVDLNSIKIKQFGKDLAAPFFIEAMTGGSQKSKLINKQLGIVAAKTKIAMALGSASILVKEQDKLDSFYQARNANPDGLILANINPLTPAKSAEKIVTSIEADALQIHLNTVQEAAMPEGERNFQWLDNMLAIRQEVTKPIIIKEVGFGFDQDSLLKLKNAGFNLFDVAGSGGTNFAEIENRRNDHDVSYLEDIGLSTVLTALIANKLDLNYYVSGGVRSPLDVLKGLSLGGKMVGVANFFLQTLNKNGENGLFELIENWKNELAILMAVYGKSKTEELTNIKKYYDLELLNQIKQILLQEL